MLDKREFLDRRLGGQPTLYEAEKHIGLLYEILKDGKDVSSFCMKADIGRTTFYNWLKRHEEFCNAYDILQNHAESYWFDKAEKSDINHSIWLYIMKTRFNPNRNYRKQTCLKILSSCNTFGEMQRIIINKIADGELTTDEGNIWIDLIGKAIKTEDIAHLIEKITILEKKVKEKI